MRKTVLTILGATLATIPAAHAQVQRSGGGASAQLVQQYQQAVSERTQLQADNEKLKKELDDTRKQLDAVKQQLAVSKKSATGAGAVASQLAAAQAAAQTASQSLEQTKTRMQDLVSKFRETAVTLRGVESDRTEVQQQLAKSKADFDRCAERNAQLRQIDNEVLDQYEHQGALSYMARGEPFTRLKRSQVENFADETRERAEELRIQRTEQSAPGPRPDAPVQFSAPQPPSEPGHAPLTSPAATPSLAPNPSTIPPAGGTTAP